ncbi:MAG: IclR family transcriptional regulator [Acidimicrobiales bacterium]
MPNNMVVDRYQVQSVARAMEILELVASAGEGGLSLTEISHGVGMAKSSTIAAARTLARFGLLQIDDPGPRYRLGLALLRYGDLVAQQTSLGKSALPLLHHLTETTGLTARLATSDHGYPVFVERVDGRGAVRFHTPLGQRELPHATAAGKVILAYLAPGDAQRVIDEAGLPRHTAKTLTDPSALQHELERVRLVGYGVDNEEESEGIICVGAPIFDHAGGCVGAISLTGLKVDIPEGDVGRLGHLVREAADRLTSILSGGRAS